MNTHEPGQQSEPTGRHPSPEDVAAAGRIVFEDNTAEPEVSDSPEVDAVDTSEVAEDLGGQAVGEVIEEPEDESWVTEAAEVERMATSRVEALLSGLEDDLRRPISSAEEMIEHVNMADTRIAREAEDIAKGINNFLHNFEIGNYDVEAVRTILENIKTQLIDLRVVVRNVVEGTYPDLTASLRSIETATSETADYLSVEDINYNQVARRLKEQYPGAITKMEYAGSDDVQKALKGVPEELKPGIDKIKADETKLRELEHELINKSDRINEIVQALYHRNFTPEEKEEIASISQKLELIANDTPEIKLSSVLGEPLEAVRKITKKPEEE